MGKSKVKLEKDLLEKVKKLARLAGYSSPEEFIAHCLEKEIAKAEADIKRVDDKLANPKFVERAPEEVVEEEKEKREEAQARRAMPGSWKAPTWTA